MNIVTAIGCVEILTKNNFFYGFLRTNAQNAARGIYLSRQYDYRVFTIFAHPIIYGIFLVSLFWCNKFLIKNKFIKTILQIILLINLFFTQSRSAWLAFAITIILYYVKIIINKKSILYFKITYKQIFIFSFITVLIIICSYFLQNQISHIFNQIYGKFITATDDSYNDPSRIQRFGMTKEVVDYMLNNGIVNFLFGNGFGSISNFLANIQIMILGYSTSDNQYISFFYEFGFIGLLLYCIIIGYIITILYKTKITNINIIPTMCFLTISISMMFIEVNIWSDLYIFLIINLFFICVKNSNNNKGIDGYDT